MTLYLCESSYLCIPRYIGMTWTNVCFGVHIQSAYGEHERHPSLFNAPGFCNVNEQLVNNKFCA